MQHEQLALFGGACQRWRHRRGSWRRSEEGGFDRSRYLVLPLPEHDARDFVLTHHYSSTWPAARLRYGLYELATLDLVGVTVLGVPMSKYVLTRPFPTLTPYQQSLELSRLVLLDKVPANAESWFVGQVFDQASQEGVRGVVAYSDPMPRANVMPGHVGIVYQASNATYIGRACRRNLVVLPDQTVLTDRAISKVRNGERGADGVLARLAKLGAPDGAPLREQLAEIGARSVPHRGNHRFCFTLGNRRQRSSTPIGLPSLPYPKTIDQPTEGALITV